MKTTKALREKNRVEKREKTANRKTNSMDLIMFNHPYLDVVESGIKFVGSILNVTRTVSFVKRPLALP